MTTLMVIYELDLLIFKMSNRSSYGEAYKKLFTPLVRSIIKRKKKFSLFLSLFVLFFVSFILLTLLFFLPFIYTIKVIYTHLCFYFILEGFILLKQHK